MRSFFVAHMRRMPVYLATLGVVLATVASCWYAVLAVQWRVPMHNWIYLGWLLLHFVTTGLLVWALWLQREWFGLRTKAATVAYAVTAGWWCLPGPLYFLLTVNLNDLQLRWTNFGWMWELAMVGFVLLGGVAVWLLRPIRAYVERGRKPENPTALYHYTLRYPRNMALVLIASAVLAFIIGNWQISQFSFLPFIEQAKIVIDGLVTALFAALFYYFCFDVLLSRARRQLEHEYELNDPPRRSFARRILSITLVITVGSLALISVAVIQSSQTLIHDSVRTELARDMEVTRVALTQAGSDTGARTQALAVLVQGERGWLAESAEQLQTSGIGLDPTTLATVTTQESGVTSDAYVEHKLVGWLIDPSTGVKVISVVFLSDFYSSLVHVLRLYSLIALIVVAMTVLVTTVASEQLVRALRHLAAVVRHAQDNAQPFVYDTHTGDELEDLAHAFTYYSATVQQQTGKLREAIQHLQELDRVKSEFISTASHQLRTPLTGLKWCYDALLSGDFGTLQPPQQEVAKQGLAKTVFMINLVNSLLDVARLEDSNVSLTLGTVDLPALIQQLITDLEPLAAEKNITVTLTPPPAPLPPIQADAERLHIVFTNLLDNAIKYTPANGTVTVGITGDSREVRVAVSDTGIGIPAETKHRLFTKFFRAPNAMMVHTSGSGLGLYITKGIVTHHGGRITVKSDAKHGTTFTVMLPVKQLTSAVH